MSPCLFIIKRYRSYDLPFTYLFFLQNGHGRWPAQEQWVFGMVDTSTKPAVGYMRLVQDRTAATLMAIISAHVAPGTEVWGNQWASYHNVGTIPGVTAHRTVNHSVQFVTDELLQIFF